MNQSKIMSKQPPKKKEIEPLTVRSPRKGKISRPIIEPTNLWAIAIFLVVTIAFFSPFLFGKAFLWEDFLEQFFPHEVFAARSFHSGVIPFWDPYTFCGMPFLADLQNGFFYPGNLLMYILSGEKLGVWLTQFMVIVHYLIAMIGMWKLARGFRIGGWGAIFAGVSYGLSGMLVVHMIHPNMLFHLAWFPVILYLFNRAIDERSWFHTLLCGLVLGLTLLSGHPQSALFIIFFLGCYTVFVLTRDLRGDDPARKSSVLVAAVMAALVVGIGAGVFAIQLLPAQELAGLSERATYSTEQLATGSIGFGHLVTLVVPKIFGVVTGDTPADLQYWYQRGPFFYWETAIYVGVVVLLLAALGLASRSLGSFRWFLAGMILFSFLYALGDNFFLHGLLSKLPLFDKFRIPTRMMMFLSLGAALLAGAGLERVIRGGEGENNLLMKVALIVGGAIVFVGFLAVSGTLAGMFNAPQELATRVSSTGIVPILIGGGSLVIVWAVLKGKMPGLGGAVALLLLGVIDLFIFGVEQNTSPVNPEMVYERNDQQFTAFKADPPEKIFRLKMREGGAMLMQRNQGPYSGIMLFEGYNPLLLERRVPPTASPETAYDLMDVRYAVQIDSAAGRMGVVERPTAYPHVRMLYDARVGGHDEVLSMLKDERIDFGKTVLLESAPGITLDGTGSGTAKITKYDASALDVSVKTDKPGILLLSEVWYPAWQPYIDGTEVPLLIGNSSLRAVAVPAGEHNVTFRFESSAFRLGLWITLGTLLGSLAGVILLGLRRRRAAAESAIPATP